MAFTSYAQNFEDVMLWRALKHVRGGCYVDIGAQHPTIDSVSRGFYENGWRGIHVEPVPQYANLLRLDRPDEIVLQVALSDQAGALELNVFEGTGLSTAVEAYAEQHTKNHSLKSTTLVVPTLEIRTALAFLKGQDVHWMKIDVEGFEEQVLRGWDSAALRPWIILIEATEPMSTRLNYQAADRIILGAGYKFVYFDGLNRFYIAHEHLELATAFASPPNVFDEFSVSGLASSEICRVIHMRHADEIEKREKKTSELSRHFDEQQKVLEAHIKALSTDNSKLSEAISRLSNLLGQSSDQLREAHQVSAHFQAVATSAELRLQEIQKSTSWRLTAPLRHTRNLTLKLNPTAKGISASQAMKNRVRHLLQISARQVAKRPKLKFLANLLLCLTPTIKARLVQAVSPKGPKAKLEKKIVISQLGEKILQEIQVARKIMGTGQQ